MMRSIVAGLILFIGLSVAGFSGGRDVSVESGDDRMDAWAAGLEMIRAHPFKGVGFGRFMTQIPVRKLAWATTPGSDAWTRRQIDRPEFVARPV